MSIALQIRGISKAALLKASFMLFILLLLAQPGIAQTLPYTLTNNSTFADDEIYVAVVGISDGYVWVDCRTGAVNPMSVAYNTVAGPVIDGDLGPGGNGLYADCFTRLSDIPNKTVNIPQISGCRILISFQSQLYLYFFGSTGSPCGYSAPNPANPTDPNQDVRFEMIELTYNDGGLWCNTTRVDSYQYPMGLEVWGNDNFYKKVGELQTHEEIIAAWNSRMPAEFQGCLNQENGIIRAPSKYAAFQEGGIYNDYMQSYIDAIWQKYKTEDLIFTSDAGIWKGRVQADDSFVFYNTTNSFGNATGIISGRPNTQEALEGKGVLAEDVQQLPDQQLDKVVQAQMCAALNRHAVDLNAPAGTTQDWSDNSKFYQQAPSNYYSSFWHQADISYAGLAYGFCYDDVYSYSSTIHTPDPVRINITIGGFAGTNSNDQPITLYQHCDYGGYVVGLGEGSYTLSQLQALGAVNDDLSSLRVQPGYQVTLYQDDNFQGASLVKTADDSCLVDDGFNDMVSSLVVSKTASAWSVTIEAEDYYAMSGIDTETCAEGGLNVGWIETGDWMAYSNITIPETGAYTVAYRVASLDGGGRLSLDLNAGSIVLGERDIPGTGDWQNWTTVQHTVNIDAGTYDVGIYAAQGGWNINWFRIARE